MANVRTRAEASSIQATLHSPILDSDRGRIILSDLSGLIVCIRAQDGKTIWKRDLGDRDIYTYQIIRSPRVCTKIRYASCIVFEREAREFQSYHVFMFQ